LSPNTIRILVADDHWIARAGVTTALRLHADMVVIGEAANGRQAIELYRKHMPDVALLDVRMPILSGIDAAISIRAEFPRARLIALSTYEGDEDIRRALNAGVKAYLTKDVLNDELIDAIRTVHMGRSYMSARVAAALSLRMLPADLSFRELEVLELIVEGMTNKSIGLSLNISEFTVKNHVRSILEKLGADDRTQAATMAIQRGIVHLDGSDHCRA
jgi:two-component system NarL family response regulator